jgi:hypothetical protein
MGKRRCAVQWGKMRAASGEARAMSKSKRAKTAEKRAWEKRRQMALAFNDAAFPKNPLFVLKKAKP